MVELKTPRGTPETRNMVRNFLLDSIAKMLPCACSCRLNTRPRFREPLPMLYSPSHRNHAKFFQSLGGLDGPQCPSIAGHPGHRASTEPPAPCSNETNH